MNIETQLASAALTIAMRGAGEYLRAHNLTASPDSLKACLSAWVKVKLPEALKDAREAFDCNMHQVGVQTFTVSMIQAGIEAAKECSMPVAA